jgi:hypothetical protein
LAFKVGVDHARVGELFAERNAKLSDVKRRCVLNILGALLARPPHALDYFAHALDPAQLALLRRDRVSLRPSLRRLANGALKAPAILQPHVGAGKADAIRALHAMEFGVSAAAGKSRHWSSSTGLATHDR